MKCTGTDEENVTLFNLNLVYVVKEGVILNGFSEFVGCKLLIEAVNKLCTLVAIKYIPCLGLAVAIFVNLSVFIIGMNLY